MIPFHRWHVELSTMSSNLRSQIDLFLVQMLGNKLYPLVEQLDPEQAGKMTGDAARDGQVGDPTPAGVAGGSPGQSQ